MQSYILVDRTINYGSLLSDYRQPEILRPVSNFRRFFLLPCSVASAKVHFSLSSVFVNAFFSSNFLVIRDIYSFSVFWFYCIHNYLILRIFLTDDYFSFDHIL